MTKHSDPAVLEALDLAWDDERGYLGLLRAGVFSEDLGNQYVELLGQIEIEEGERLHPDFVRLVWFAPLYTEWQQEGFADRGKDSSEMVKIGNLIRERLMEILGIP